jgi:NACalpha-BTF3-like transcription factor
MQDISNIPAAAPSKVGVPPLTLGAAVCAIRSELGFSQELGMRDTVFAAWAEIDWSETEARSCMSLKEQVTELCTEMSIRTGWDIPPQLAFSAEGCGFDPAGVESPRTCVAHVAPTIVASTPERVVKARANRRANFLGEMKAEAQDCPGVQVSAEKFLRDDPLCRPLMPSDLFGAEEQTPVECIEDEDEDEDEGEVDAGDLDTEQSAPAHRIKRSRSETKSRKAVQKLGMVGVAGVRICTVKKANGVVFTIRGPDVFSGVTSAGGDAVSYVIFGEALVEEHNQSGGKSAAAAAVTQLPPRAIFPGGNTQVAAASAAASASGGVTAAAVDDIPQADIEVVLAQSKKGASQIEVCGALRKHGGDIISAIMELS